jgi:hypothetical protein
MGGQNYERVSNTTININKPSLTYSKVPENEDDAIDDSHSSQQIIPDSPPPPFRSRASSVVSRRQPSGQVDQTLADTFDAENENENDAVEDDRQRLIRDATTNVESTPRQGLNRNTTAFPSFFGSNRSHSAGPAASSNDGVFANLSAKPDRGEKLEEQPPVSQFILLYTIYS